MFEFIHHVRILVHDAEAMAAYMEENFGMTPVKIEVLSGPRHEECYLQSWADQRGVHRAFGLRTQRWDNIWRRSAPVRTTWLSG